MKNDMLVMVQKELRESADEATRQSFHRFFKEDVRFYGVKTSAVSSIAARHFAGIKDKEKQEVFALCEELFKSGYCEDAFIACEWAYRQHKQYEPSDFEWFEQWVKNYVTNWAVCDTLCSHTVGAFMERYPAYVDRLYEWARSKNRWVRRAAAVTLIVPAKHGKFLKEAFTIADILLKDKEDLVQKGYGWLLKEASRLHHREVFDYLMKYRDVMPRTAFRYALEKMPAPLRTKAMSK